ncbi:MAG: putative DNA modification/repair radical SAM protein [Angelakisella sp.]|nr:putative DNA modification/repair radical SAM protein [Angelakisella sp.]
MDVMEKLTILSAAARYDVSCTSSGSHRSTPQGGIGNSYTAGLCHSFAADGRCISLLKVLMTNVCVFDCRYCINRRSNDTPRAAFTPRELADLTIQFYRRNYIEGLFLSSGVIRNPDYTCEQMITTLELLREQYRFGGYIHVKTIPGADDALTRRLALLADRVSVNIEMPSNDSLTRLCPEKTKTSILGPMGFLRDGIQENSTQIVRYRHAPKFAPAGQSTQMIIGATPETDLTILRLTQGLYRKYRLKRVFFSAYVPLVEDALLPAGDVKPPLLREHRLYQADWLLRFYGFDAEELLDEEHPAFSPFVDPKCNWALNHLDRFPVEVNTVPYELLLRVPGVGVKSAQRILTARRHSRLDWAHLKKIGVVLKRAQYFLLCGGKRPEGLRVTQDGVLRALISQKDRELLASEHPQGEQLSLFAPPTNQLTREDVVQCLTGQI